MTPHLNPETRSQDRAMAYELEIRERGKRLSLEPMPDPFHNTTIRPRGWRVALDVLLRRYSLEVIVGGDRDRVEQVLELNPDYLGPPGSPSREAWKKQLDGSLRDFAAVIAEHEDDDVGRADSGGMG